MLKKENGVSDASNFNLQVAKTLLWKCLSTKTLIG